MTTHLHLDDVRRAWEARDPDLVSLIQALAAQPPEPPTTPPREGAPTFDRFLAEIRSTAFHKKPAAEQAHYRIEGIKALEAPDAEVPLPERLRLHEIILRLWEDQGPYARGCLLRVIAGIRLTYGPWRALKRIFKEAEARGDTEVYGALAARFDAALAAGEHGVSRDTLAYLCRRAWRYLRRTAQTLPACYADAAVDFLAPYTDATSWVGTWVANHVFYHETHEYNRRRFRFRRVPDTLLKYRAFPELWQRSPRPLFTLLERARSEQVRGFATSALKSDFRAMLRDVEPAWVARLVHVGSAAIDSFVVWILNNVPRFEQTAFRTLGLHEAVLRLLDSPADDARAYAAEYARTHARDLPVAELIRLANNTHPAVRMLAADLLQARDPRKEVGLEAWGALLETRYGHELAGAMLKKHFGARELTPAWFTARLLSESPHAFAFASTLLPQIHPPQKLGAGFFTELIDRVEDDSSEAAERVIPYALRELTRFDVNTLDTDFLRRLLVRPRTWGQACAWIDEGRLAIGTVPVAFFKVLAYHPAWESDPWVAALKASGRPWARELAFHEPLADRILGWMRDPRRFAPTDLGFAWLLQLVSRSEPRYHDFAVEVLIKAFTPADFAPAEAAPVAAAPAVKATVDLGGATFLFTGKLATMNRKEAEDKVRNAGGAVASGVTAKLHYLVIGDEGSPLYGHGKKGSKQVKAEELNAAGANIKIISETAFLQMLVGGQRVASADATLAGCERLWQMATAPGLADAPLAAFARTYLRRHHPDIALAETDRPVDPGAEVPPAFLTFERVEPLFFETRKPLRDFALDLAAWEFARWAPSIDAIMRLSESPHEDVRRFVTKALLAEDTPEHRRYRIDPAVLTPAAVYRFCESVDEATRALGMELIRRSPRLRVPEELFRLTESPDRKVRAFVIRALWALYRERGTTADWRPTVPPQPALARAAPPDRGPGVPHRPEQLPAALPSLAEFLRRILFEIPPGRSDSAGAVQDPALRLRPLPHRRAKLALVEVMRDLALEDAAFAGGVLPLLQEFMDSRGQSERAACLVAVTRIRTTHPALAPAS